jgi:hypothetical protein
VCCATSAVPAEEITAFTEEVIPQERPAGLVGQHDQAEVGVHGDHGLSLVQGRGRALLRDVRRLHDAPTVGKGHLSVDQRLQDHDHLRWRCNVSKNVVSYILVLHIIENT